MRSVPAIAAVVFDLDGLMFNTEDLYREALHLLLERRGHVCTDELYHAMMGRPAPVALQILIDRVGLEETIEALTAESIGMVVELLPQRLAPMPGLLPLLAALEQRPLPKAIATSSSRFFLKQLLGRYQLEPRFQFTLTAEDVTHGKPHPEIYLAAAARFGIEPQQMLVLEDSATGCKAAVDAGAFAVAVPNVLSRNLDFTGARLVIDSLADPRLATAIGLPT